MINTVPSWPISESGDLPGDCPICGGDNVDFLATYNIFRCQSENCGYVAVEPVALAQARARANLGSMFDDFGPSMGEILANTGKPARLYSHTGRPLAFVKREDVKMPVLLSDEEYQRRLDEGQRVYGINDDGD